LDLEANDLRAAKNYRAVLGHAIPGDDPNAREERALRPVPLLVKQTLAIGLARWPTTFAASHIDIAAWLAAADAESGLIRRVDRWSPD